MGMVQFKLDSEEARAVQGLLRVVDAERKIAREGGNIQRSARASESSMRKMGSTAGRELLKMPSPES